MNYQVDTGFRKPKFIFATHDEALRFDKEYFRKNKVHASICGTTQKVSYIYDSNCKLKKV